MCYLPHQTTARAEHAPHVEPVECAPGDRQVSVRLGTCAQSQLTDTPPGSFGCCGTIAALMLSEGRRRQAQRYALIGQATEDLDEVPSLDPARPGCSSRSLARAQDFVDVEAQGEEAGAEDDDDDDGLDLPRLSPPPALQSPAPALQSEQPALLSPQPALQSPQPVATPVTPVVAAVEGRPACSAPRPGTRPPAAQLTASACRPCDGPCDGSRTCSTSRCLRRRRWSLPS